MIKVVGVRFKSAGKVYDFNAGAFVLNIGAPVIVETEQGLGFGFVAVASKPVEDADIKRPLKKVFRMAGEKDFEQREKNVDLEKQAHNFCLDCITQLGLEMNLFAVETTFDASKMTFFFTAEGRVDFRELVKMLVKEYRIRIEMRQVGIRNQAKMCGGTGRCGRVLCCSTFLEKFEPVSIRMAKEQGLSLNPTKISGQCGRLMCCLTYENETYIALKAEFPKIGKTVKTKSGKGRIIRNNVICSKVSVLLEDGGEIEIKLDEILS
ncbi:regulatory iron-sulfur-containing complex subunit RicT [Desulfobacterales bacterium HSG17]|nr:regulatory iron-sulfur-containing complex subunit RicT [Desulfobacterales bacterium HSG17]